MAGFSPSKTAQHAANAAYHVILAFCESRNACEVLLENGEWAHVSNAVTGQDLGEKRFHMTTNIGVDPALQLPAHFFYLDEVVRVRDFKTKEVAFDRGAIPSADTWD